MSDSFNNRYKGTRARRTTTGFAEFGSQVSGFASKVVRKMGSFFGTTKATAEDKTTYPSMQKLNRR
jgi:hypothetical protein